MSSPNRKGPMGWDLSANSLVVSPNLYLRSDHLFWLAWTAPMPKTFSWSYILWTRSEMLRQWPTGQKTMWSLSSGSFKWHSIFVSAWINSAHIWAKGWAAVGRAEVIHFKAESFAISSLFRECWSSGFRRISLRESQFLGLQHSFKVELISLVEGIDQNQEPKPGFRLGRS